ncbi:MAG: RHS repeat-associated core domain-containing protein, partial [Planctomycetota bacterium]
VDEIVQRDRDTTGDTTLDERVYSAQNANWGTNVLMDKTGSVQERFSYLPYGASEVLTPSYTSRATSSCEWELRFSGYRWEASTEFYLVRYRSYIQNLGIWLQRDPLGRIEGPNLYRAYFVPDKTDPLGLKTAQECCTEAVKKGEDRGDIGGIICCDGIPVQCLFRYPKGLDNPKTKEITKTCVLKHERDHLDDIRECDKNDPCKRAVFRIRTQDFKNEAECYGHLVEFECLKAMKSLCGADAECHEQVQGRIDYVHGEAVKYCLRLY